MKIVVIGVSGMLGHKMLQVLHRHFPGQVYGTVRDSHKKEIVAAVTEVPASQLIDGLEAGDISSLLRSLKEIAPTHVINCVGLTLRKEDHQSLNKNYDVNAYLPRALAFWCAQNQARLIHFSTDCVFSGAQGSYRETDFPDASDVYGKSKFLGEVSGPASLTLRLSIIGREVFQRTELIEWFLSQKNKSLKGFSEIYYSGLTTLFVAEEVARLLQKFPKLTGLYHVSAPRISKYELLVLARELLNSPCEITPDSSKRSDKSLNCDLYVETTGFIKPTWEKMLSDLAADSVRYNVNLKEVNDVF